MITKEFIKTETSKLKRAYSANAKTIEDYLIKTTSYALDRYIKNAIAQGKQSYETTAEELFNNINFTLADVTDETNQFSVYNWTEVYAPITEDNAYHNFLIVQKSLRAYFDETDLTTTLKAGDKEHDETFVFSW